MGSMSPLFIDNNLGDLEDVDEARTNLGLGNMSTMSSNDVLITGGRISVEDFKLKPDQEISSSNYFLRASDVSGKVEWHHVNGLDWLSSNPNDINVSKFHDDMNYVTRDSLATVAFTGDFNDLCNVPQSIADVYNDDILYKFLVIESNLSDIADIESARSNLGLGSLATQDSNDVKVNELNVRESLILPHNIGTGFLFIDEVSNISAVASFDIATDEIPGIVLACNVNTSNPDSVPTSELLSNVHFNLQVDIESTKLSNINTVIGMMNSNDKFLVKSNFLAEFSNENDKFAVRNNLGLGDMCVQSSNDVTVSNLVVGNLSFNSNGLVANKKLLSFDETNSSKFVDIIDIAPPSASDPGVVYTISDFDQYTPDANSEVSVLTAGAFTKFADKINERLTHVQNSIPSDINDLRGDDTYLNSVNNLSDLQDIETAKSNLGLAKVASTGKYEDLAGRPFAISGFNNDIGFIESSNNLSDITDKELARRNLGLGTMATQDIDDVRIQGGFVQFEQLEVKQEFIFKDDNNPPNGKILRCVDANGRMEWGDIPVASFTEYGTVKISDHVKINDERTDVVPNCKAFSVIEDSIYKKMELAIRNYVLTPAFTERVLFMDEVKKTEFSNMEHEHRVALSNFEYVQTQLENTSNLDFQKFLVSNLTVELSEALPLISNLSSNNSNQSNVIFENTQLIENQIITIDDLYLQNSNLVIEISLLDSNNTHQSNVITILNELVSTQSENIINLNNSNSLLSNSVLELESNNHNQSNQIVDLSILSSAYSNDIDDLIVFSGDLENDLEQERRKLFEALQKIEILEGNAYASEYGYLVNYGLVLHTDNSVQMIRNADFFIGVGFDLSPPTNVIIKAIDAPLFGMSNDGSYSLLVQEDINGPSNIGLFGGSISIDMTNDNSLHVIPVHTATTIRDAFPVNILDLTTHEGSRKFKSDFDNVGSLLYSRDGRTFSGMNALCGFVQLSDPNLHAQAVSRDESIFLRRNEIIVDFIAYYHLPLLFEHVKDHNELVQYDYYMSSLVENRLDDKVYKVLSGQSSIEIVNYEQVEIQNTVLGNYNISFYPHVRVIKWKNEYDPTFNFVGIQDVSESFSTALGWGNPFNTATIINKYINTNNGSNWIHKLTELTFAYLKYGKPLKTLNVADMLVVDSICSLISAPTDPNMYFQLETFQTGITFRIKKEAFSGYLY